MILAIRSGDGGGRSYFALQRLISKGLQLSNERSLPQRGVAQLGDSKPEPSRCEAAAPLGDAA